MAFPPPEQTDWRLDSDDARQGWKVGLVGASLLRQHFPAFWAAHVAQKAITTSRLLGVFHAFVELAHRELLRIEIRRDLACPLDLGTPPEDIPELVDGYEDEGGILWTLANELQWWIFHPPVEVHGLDGEELRWAWGRGEARLSMALAWMLRHTAWQQPGPTPNDLRRWPGGRQIAALPRLAATTEMDALVARLDAESPWPLGGMIRLLCGQTHNEFADLCPAEAAQEMAWWVEDIYRDPPRLAYEGLRQQAAARLRAAFDDLDGAIQQQPALLQTVGMAIAATAEALPARPATLAAILAADPREEAVCVDG